MEIFLDTGARPGRPSRRFPVSVPEIERKADPPGFYRAALRAALGSAPLAAVVYALFHR
jgi:hypothetical protein